MSRPPRTESPWVRGLLILAALLALGFFLILPLAVVFAEAFRAGLSGYVAAVLHPDTLAALRLTLLVTALAVPPGVVFGLAAGWALGKFRFPGRSVLLTLIDLPFATSPVVAGMLLVLLFGRTGLFGPWLVGHGLSVIFAVPGIVLATAFVTFPYVARELVPLMQSAGSDEEEAARALGAGFLTTYARVTLPAVKWGVLYGSILAAARALGEFGAVSVVSGHIRGRTNTLPLQVQALYDEYDSAGAFAVASLLTAIALVSLGLKAFVEARSRRELEARAARQAETAALRSAA